VGPYDTRYQRFMQQAPFNRVVDSRSVDEIIKSSGAKPEVVQQQMKDVSEMIVLDTLLSQDDRIGNIHFHLYWTKLEGNRIIKTLLEKADLVKVEAQFKGKPLSRVSESALASVIDPRGVLTRVMTLKDNDCGVDVDKRSNNMRVISAIEQVRHMSKKTYEQLLKMKALVDKNDPAFLTFFRDTLLYRAADFSTSKKSFVDNLNRVISVITKNAGNVTENSNDGILKLDLINESVELEIAKK
jgi:hypothetical protein